MDSPENSKTNGGKVAAIVIGGIVVVIFLALIFDNNSSPTTSFSSNAPTTTATADSQPAAPTTNNDSQEIQNLQSQINQLKQQQQPAQPQSNSSQITSADIAPYLSGIGLVICERPDANGNEKPYDTGSGSLWEFSGGTYDIVTNRHVVAGNNMCYFAPPVGQELYSLDMSNSLSWNSLSDIAVLKILDTSHNGQPQPSVSSLNYSVSQLRSCPQGITQGSPVEVVGYPAFALNPGLETGTGFADNVQTVTQGIISGFPLADQGLPYNNYSVSATIDSGSSGGVAFSKDANGLCLLGIPTWITVGNYQTEGVVQNINDVKYVP